MLSYHLLNLLLLLDAGVAAGVAVAEAAGVADAEAAGVAVAEAAGVAVPEAAGVAGLVANNH